MRGTVKWFSAERGYGFITSKNGDDCYFSVQDVEGFTMPSGGESADFDEKQGPKGLRAVRVRLLLPPESARTPTKSRDDRAECRHCGKRMVPRIITMQGMLRKSVCPFCGGTHQLFPHPTVIAFKLMAIGFIVVSVVPLVLQAIASIIRWLFD